MRYPEFIKPGDTIGYVAPSFGCSMEPYKTAFQNALKKLEYLGYGSVLGPNVYEQNGTGISNAPDKCAAEFMEAYVSEDSDALISCGGGELMCEILSFMDFERIAAAEPKWFMGYSDNTNLVFPLTTLCDTAAVYGPCASSFGMEPWHESISDALKVLTGEKLTETGYPTYEIESGKDEENPLATINATEPRVLTLLMPTGGRLQVTDAVSMRGRLVGGCLDCLVNLLGTRFDRTAEFVERYKDDGVLWFIEACDLNVFSIRRALWQMKEAGWFKYASGVLVGRPLNGEEMFGLDHIRAFAEPLAELGVPVVIDTDIGHVSPMMPVISGAVGEYTAEGQEQRLVMKLV